MTPSWLEAHASFIDSSRTATAEQLTFNGGGSRDAALFKVPLIPAGFFKVNTPLTVEITVANDVTIGTTVDSDISFGASDGTRFIGFDTCDKGNYSLRASSSFGGYREKYTRERHARGDATAGGGEEKGRALLSPAPRGFAARSRVLARLASLAQIGELARRPGQLRH